MSREALALHDEASDHNWDDGLARLRAIARTPGCDGGTLLMLFWRSSPHSLRRFETRADVPSFQRELWDFMQAVMARYLRGENGNVIPYDPKTEGTIRATDDQEEHALWTIPEQMLRPNAAVQPPSDVDALFAAIEAGDEALLREALDGGVDANAQRDRASALNVAARAGKAALVRLLLEHGANPNTAEPTRDPLWNAAHGGHLEVVRALLEGGADPDYRDRSYGGALHLAVRNKDHSVARLLIELGAKVDLIGDRKTPLMLLGFDEFFDLDMARLLLDAGANPTKAFHGAMHDQLDFMELLLSHGAKFDRPDRAGETPLYWAVNRQAPAAVRRLLELGADPDRPRKKDARTPRQNAELKPVDEILELFRNPPPKVAPPGQKEKRKTTKRKRKRKPASK